MPKKKKNNKKWFKPVRGSYLPANNIGALTYIPFVSYLLLTLFYTRELNCSIIIKLYFIIVQWLLALAIMTYIAQKKS